MSELVIWTYDWVPEGPRGFVRDLRLRWACEEAGLAHSLQTVPFNGRETNHLDRQPSKVREFGHRPATEAYIRRVTDRPAFRKARADQLAHFAAADAGRAAGQHTG